MFYKFFAVLMLLVSCGEAAAFERKSFMPENTLWRQDSGIKNISQNDFNGILDKIEAVYTPIFASFGAQFSLQRAWDDSTVNAYADQQGNNWMVKMFGGMARRSEINVIGFGLVACHEVGHHLGGFPKYAGEWAANEGQSDYFATFVCAKKVLAGYPVPQIPDSGRKKCDAAYTDQLDRETCYKSVSGGLALSKLLAALGNSPEPSIDTPDTRVVSKTSDSHPAAQCRLDTMLAAAICKKSWNDKLIPKTADAVCDNRPRCWYAPAGSPNPGPNPDPNPEPTPDPNPDGEGQADEIMMELVNGLRPSSPLTFSSALLCAALWHTDDMMNSKQCSPYGSDHSNPMTRARACGFMGQSQEIFVCGAPSSRDAFNYLIKNRFNRGAMSSRFFSQGACAVTGNVYSCVLGQ